MLSKIYSKFKVTLFFLNSLSFQNGGAACNCKKKNYLSVYDSKVKCKKKKDVTKKKPTSKPRRERESDKLIKQSTHVKWGGVEKFMSSQQNLCFSYYFWFTSPYLFILVLLFACIHTQYTITLSLSHTYVCTYTEQNANNLEVLPRI